MSLDVSLNIVLCKECWNSEEVYSANITHNLNTMAEKAGIYKALRRPAEINKQYAYEIIPILEEWLKKLKAKPSYYQKFNSPNWRGMYEHFVPFVEKYLEACRQYPASLISVSV